MVDDCTEARLNNFVSKYYCRNPRGGDIAFDKNKTYQKYRCGIWVQCNSLDVGMLVIDLLRRLVYVHGCRETLKLRVENALKEG